MDLHHVVEAAGVIAFGVLIYSFSRQWLDDAHSRLAVARRLLNGLAFGALAVGLAVARIQVAPDVYFDARNVPIALIALFEGWTAGLLAAALVAIYRWGWLGGPGAIPGVVSVFAAGAAGAFVHWWATRRGRVGSRHAFALGVLTFFTTLLGYAMLGRPGLEKFASTWPHFLVAYVVGIGVIAQLFAMVVERERLNAAERRFRALLDEASEAIRIVDPATWKILETNRADSALSGYPREALLGRDGREFWPQDAEERKRWHTLLKETAANGAAGAFGLGYQAPAGMRSIDLTCRRVHHDGRPYDIVIFRDATSREALDAAHREVLDLRAVTLVANAAAHEINNPLTVIVGSLELLHRRVTGDTQAEKWVERGVGSAERIRDIIARMTHITRLSPVESAPGIPAMLDIRRSSEDN